MAQTEGILERRRKIEFPFHYSAEKRIFHVVAKVRDQPRTLASLLNVLGTELNLIGTTSYSLGDGTAIFSGFAEVLEESIAASSLQSLISEYPYVFACRVWESNNGFLVDWFHTGMQTGLGEPYIMLPIEGLSPMFGEVVKTFGSGGETILYLEGAEFAKKRFEQYKKILGPDPRKRVKEAAGIFNAMGYGRPSILQRDSDTVVLEVKDCFECSGKDEYRTSCAFMRGLLSGFFGALSGKAMMCDELECRLKGQEQCVFQLTPRN